MSLRSAHVISSEARNLSEPAILREVMEAAHVISRGTVTSMGTCFFERYMSFRAKREIFPPSHGLGPSPEFVLYRLPIFPNERTFPDDHGFTRRFLLTSFVEMTTLLVNPG